ncbi:hypothetical protein HY00_00160 [Peptococcaceae bacterium SCADC1_2_3]|jgi:hypothetical protein|nr:hypothetical protein HY00_00120 [Peptococcaceae bacterium SCADC1_2_3]KFI36346.1 hypothetical protein HY00_00160 [Peptococcaceae bacterium SCADC1_2_3]
MIKGSSKKLPKFSSVGELVNFFEKHDLGEYWDQMPEAEFDIEIKKRKHTFTIDEDIAIKLTEIARSKRVPAEELVNLWLKEKISEVG